MTTAAPPADDTEHRGTEHGKTMTTTYAGYSYGLAGYILRMTVENSPDQSGLRLTNLPEVISRPVAETTELVMSQLRDRRFRTETPGTVVHYEPMNADDPRPENLGLSDLRSLATATAIAVMAHHGAALKYRAGQRPLEPAHIAGTVIAANNSPYAYDLWQTKLLAARGSAAIADAARDAELRLLTSEHDSATADAALPFPRSMSATTLADAVAVLTGEVRATPPPAAKHAEDAETAKHAARLREQRDITPEQLRILEIAVAGRHNLCITTPGLSIPTGRYPRIAADLMPALSTAEADEVTRIHSAAPTWAPYQRRVIRAPLRAPHNSASRGAMVGATSSPGELALAHHGILYLHNPGNVPVEISNAIRAAVNEHRVYHEDHRVDGRITRHPSDFILMVADPQDNPDGRPPSQQALVDECCELRMEADGGATGQRTNLTEAAERVRLARERLTDPEGAKRRRAPAEALPDPDSVARTIAALDGSDTVESRHRAEAAAIKVTPAA